MTSQNFADTMIYDMKAKLAPLPHQRKERGWMNCWKYIIDLTSCRMYRHFSSMCKWYLFYLLIFCQEISVENCKLNIYFPKKWSPRQYFCWGDYLKNTVCLGKTLGNCQLPRWIARAATFFTYSKVQIYI